MMQQIEPSEIGKHPGLIEKAQKEMSHLDIHVCGKCHSVFLFIDLFKEHKANNCKRISTFNDWRETKPKVWSHLLWKQTQIQQRQENEEDNPWELYKTWMQLEEGTRQSWLSAGVTIHSFERFDNGVLQKMPLKITETPTLEKPVSRPSPVGQVVKLVISPKPVAARLINRTDPISKIIEKAAVERILTTRNRGAEHLVKWESKPQTWEPAAQLEHCKDLIGNFEVSSTKQKEVRSKSRQPSARYMPTAVVTTPGRPIQFSKEKAINEVEQTLVKQFRQLGQPSIKRFKSDGGLNGSSRILQNKSGSDMTIGATVIRKLTGTKPPDIIMAAQKQQSGVFKKALPAHVVQKKKCRQIQSGIVRIGTAEAPTKSAGVVTHVIPKASPVQQIRHSPGTRPVARTCQNQQKALAQKIIKRSPLNDLNSPSAENRLVTDSQKTTIEKLCNDVLVEIFSYLSAKDLKSATLVCKQWNELIGSSACVMKKFKLKLKESELIGRQFRSSRNYQKIELEMLASKLPSDQKSLKNFGRLFKLSQVKYFKIFANNPDPENAFTNRYENPWPTFSIAAMKLTSALKQMKLLQELFIECPAGFRGSFTSTIDLPKLTKLAVKSPDASIFQWIKARNVTEIDLSHKSDGTVTTSVQHLASFLKLGEQITTLKLNSSLLHDLFGNGKWKDFNLKLSGIDIEIIRNPDETSLSEFLISQVPSLTSLRMKSVTWSLLGSDRVVEAFSQLKNLKILSLDDGLFPHTRFLRHLPELEQLAICEDVNINHIARFNRKLTYLNIPSVTNSLGAAFKFSELKHLCVRVDPSSYCRKVIRSSPKIETIELRLSLGYRTEANSCDQIIKAAMEQPTLRHLKLEYQSDLDIELLKEAFDSITSDYGNLKSLSLSKEVGSGLRSVEFSFPENRSDWNAGEQKMRLSETFGNK